MEHNYRHDKCDFKDKSDLDVNVNPSFAKLIKIFLTVRSSSQLQNTMTKCLRNELILLSSIPFIHAQQRRLETSDKTSGVTRNSLVTGRCPTSFIACNLEN